MSDPMVLAVYQYDNCQGSQKLQASRENLTVSVILEVEKLIIPLGHNPDCIFHECADDEEASSCGYVPTASKSCDQRDVSSSIPGTCLAMCRRLLADIAERSLTVL